jgi:hypothetical protein
MAHIACVVVNVISVRGYHINIGILPSLLALSAHLPDLALQPDLANLPRQPNCLVCACFFYKPICLEQTNSH